MARLAAAFMLLALVLLLLLLAKEGEWSCNGGGNGIGNVTCVEEGGGVWYEDEEHDDEDRIFALVDILGDIVPLTHGCSLLVVCVDNNDDESLLAVFILFLMLLPFGLFRLLFLYSYDCLLFLLTKCFSILDSSTGDCEYA